ncbi:MAG: GAF domain-containing sensor histidine kinase [Polaromonas sp.]|nr:GAF domain-containing sensor histidine kinase [Polaromonas sp.]
MDAYAANPDDAELIAKDIAAIGAISAVPSMLRIVCEMTGMGFAAVARVTDGTWTACAVEDNIQFGLQVGGQLPVNTTLCIEARAARQPVAFDHASIDPQYRDHHTPRLYNIESYISVPIVLEDGEYFGNLCAIDPAPRSISSPANVAVFQRFAELIGMQLQTERNAGQVASDLLDERARSQLRENFIAVLGHDLRNPLSSVAMTAEVMMRTKAEPRIATLGEQLKATTRRMSKLIDDVLDLARGQLGSGIGVDIQEEADLARYLEDVVAELRTAHPDRAIHSQIAVTRPVRCDRGRVQQLLSNLLGNAIVYGDPTQPVMVSADLSGDVLELAVLNEGEPIPDDMQGRVFEPYWRPETSKPGAGLGLGLYICAEITRAHGGGIKVTSSREGGTLFLAQLRV